MRRMLTFFLALVLMLPGLPALAEDVCTVKDASEAGVVTTSCSYIKVRCPVGDGVRVTLTVRDEWGSLIYQRDHGICSGEFRSGEIHLPLVGESTEYRVTVTAGDAQHTFRVIRERPLLTDSAVYAYGLPLSEINGGSRRKSAVVLDMNALDRQTLTVPMVAGGMQVGLVHFHVRGGEVTVSAELTVDGSIDRATVYLAEDALAARGLGSSRFSGIKGKLDRAYGLGGTPYAAVMVQLTVSYDETTARAWSPVKREEQQQSDWWQMMQTQTANDANG